MPLKGADEVNKRIKEHMKENFNNAGVAWWDTVNEHVFQPSLDQVPYETGALSESGRCILHSTNHKHTVQVGYGSEAVEYALYQHEHTELHHPAMTRGPGTRSSRDVGIAKYGNMAPTWTPNGRKAKYLEDPVNASIPILPKELIRRLEGER